MSRQQFTPEFKDEAVRQVTEKGHSVKEVAARLGVSSHSLYKWVKAVSRFRTHWTNNLREDSGVRLLNPESSSPDTPLSTESEGRVCYRTRGGRGGTTRQTEPDA
jgi:transposase-like protein